MDIRSPINLGYNIISFHHPSSTGDGVITIE